MDAYLARENIKRFRAQLRASDNEAQQGVLRTLIKAEQDHLKLIFAAEQARPEQGNLPIFPGPRIGEKGSAAND